MRHSFLTQVFAVLVSSIIIFSLFSLSLRIIVSFDCLIDNWWDLIPIIWTSHGVLSTSEWWKSFKSWLWYLHTSMCSYDHFFRGATFTRVHGLGQTTKLNEYRYTNTVRVLRDLISRNEVPIQALLILKNTIKIHFTGMWKNSTQLLSWWKEDLEIIILLLNISV